MKNKLLMIGLLAGLTTGAAAAEPVKIGVITTLSGPGGYLGQDVRDGMKLAIDAEGGKLGGVPVELKVEDDAAKPGNGRQIAERFMSGRRRQAFYRHHLLECSRRNRTGYHR